MHNNAQALYVTGPAIKGMWAHDFCLLFHTFVTHKFLYHYAMVLQFSALSQQLSGVMIQVADCKNTISVLRYNMKSDGV